jgi:ketosteroid isomerase-like protein
MRRSVLAISAGVMMLAASGEVRAQSAPSAVVRLWAQYANAAAAAKIAALYTADAVALFSEGKFQGPAQIQKDLQTQFQAVWKNVNLTDFKDNLQGSWAWSYGEWSALVGTPPKQVKVNGYWSAVFVRVGAIWKIKQHTTNMQLSQSNG